MGQKVVVELDAEEAKLVAAWQRGRKSVEEFASSVDSITPVSTRADQATQNLGSSANKWLKAIQTPLQDYLGDLEELRALLAAGKLNQDQYNAALAISKQRLEAQNVEVDELGLKAAKLKESLITPQQKFQQELAESNQLLKAGKISQEEYAAAVAKSQKNLDATDTELQQLLASAKRVQSELTTPQQQYNAKLQELDRLLKAGKISQDEYRRAVAATKQEYVATTAAGQAMATSGQSGIQGMTGSAREMVTAVAAIAGGYKLVQTAVSAVIAENHRLGQSITDTFRKLDQEELKLQIQAGFTPQQAQAQMPNIKKALEKTPSTTLAGAIQLQTQLASSGFQTKDVNSGEALQTVLDIKAATNQFGESMGNEKEAVLALSMYLKGMGNKAPAASDIKDIGKQLVTLFATSDIQFQDLKQLSPNAGTLKSFGLDQKEQLAGFSTLVDVMGAEKAATGMRNVVTRMATAAKSKERTEALKELGFKPEDVDIAIGGDKFIPTLEKVSKALKGKKPEVANRLLAEIFGDEGQAAASELFNPEKIDLIKQRIKEQEGGAAFDLGVKSFQESGYADRQRRQVNTDYKLRQAGLNQKGAGRQDVKEIGQNAAAGAAAEGGNLSAPVAVGEGLFTAGEAAGMSPEQTAQWIQFLAGKQKRSWGQFLLGEKAAPALEIGGKRNAAGPAAAPPPAPVRDVAPPAARANAAPPAAAPQLTPAAVNDLTAAIKENTAVTRQNSNKPPVVVVTTRSSATKPTKVPRSAALADGGS